MSVEAPMGEVGKQRSGRRWGWRVLGGVVLLGVIAGVGVAGYTWWRVQEIPKVPFPPLTVRRMGNAAEILRGTDEDRDLAGRYASEMGRVVPAAAKKPGENPPAPALFGPGDYSYPALFRVSEGDKEWLEANRAWLLKEKVAGKPADEVYVRRDESLGEILKEKGTRLLDLKTLHLIAARQLMSEKKLDEALEQVLEGIRIERLMQKRQLPMTVRERARRRRMPVDDRLPGPGSQEVLKLWSLCEGQTSERVIRAIPKVEKEFKKSLRMPEQVVLQQEAVRRDLEEELSSAKVSSWEADRARRVLNLCYGAEFVQISRNLGNFQDLDEGPQIPFPSGPEGDTIERQVKRLQTEELSRDWGVRTVRRLMDDRWEEGHIGVRQGEAGTLLIMGLCAYRLDHGKLPERLTDLLGKYFEVLPHDPFTLGDFGYLISGEMLDPGRPFGTRGTSGPLLYRNDVIRARSVTMRPNGEARVVYEPFKNRDGEQASRREVILIPPSGEDLKKTVQRREEESAKQRAASEKRQREREEQIAELKKQGFEGEGLVREMSRREKEKMQRIIDAARRGMRGPAGAGP